MGREARIQLADASFLYSREYLRVLVDFGSVSHRLIFTVLDVSCPLVLGMPFLRDCNPIIDWKARTVSFPAPAAAAVEPANVFSGLDPEVPLAPVDCVGIAPCLGSSGCVARGPGCPTSSDAVRRAATPSAVAICSGPPSAAVCTAVPAPAGLPTGPSAPADASRCFPALSDHAAAPLSPAGLARPAP